MPHFPTHTGGTLVHGSPAGISQAGIGPTGERVAILGHSHRTEVRLRSATRPVTETAMSFHPILQTLCPSWMPPDLCADIIGTIPGGGAQGGPIPGQFDPGCQPPLIEDVNGVCVAPGSPVDFQHGGGVAIMGRYGAAIAPEILHRVHRDCLPGMVLGTDDLCYNRRDLRNSERKYPRGTRPLGTPGEMAALRKAASFGRRMETTVKRMQKIGVLKKPAPRKAAAKPKQLMSGPGITVIDTE